MLDTKKVVIIGGGITGLTAAYYLQKEAKAKNLALNITLIEASHKLGGKIQTVEQDGFIIERGPDSFLARKKSASILAKEVGLSDKLVSNSTGQSFVLVQDQLHPIPGGSVMGIPTQIGPFVTTGLFSWMGKARAAGDFILPKSNVQGDQPLGNFFRRRLGDEVVENLIEPLLSGIYAGDIDQMSLLSTFPQFYEIEQKHRSLVLGMKKTTPKPSVKGQKKPGIFLTFSSGLQSFVNAIEAYLEEGSIMKGVKVEEIHLHELGYELSLNNGEAMQADSVVLATPHHVIPTMLPDEPMFAPLKDVPSTSVATVAMAFNEDAIKKDIDGTGFVVSRNSDYTITACTWTHKKWPHTTPKGKVLIRCYVGRAGEEAVVDLSDGEIEKIVLDDLNKIMEIDAKPDFTIVSRWKNSMPQYTVGHKDRVKAIKEQMELKLPGVFLAGSSFEGLGLPDCIDQGEAAVRSVLEYLETPTTVTYSI
ncbi:protoporphyrinogen oxidase [Bacillus coahuilensis m2-6]|uniref:protoporphyrinogen oxidase n=1 Tax=Bacillus coahuilensis TaxID=408580 RepID=UPI0007501E6D|nr:protoporphyrinogen oxidase [Bacillus coahuilensis]KUP09167.1 protoporphyrinogen oxidase [Bacillus coahuilensis m2-6]